MGRNLSTALTGLVFASVFLGSGTFIIWHEKIPIFGSLFFGIGLILFLSFLYLPINSLTVSKNSRGEVTTVRRILGLPVKRRYAPVQDFQSLSAESHFSTGTGSKCVKHYTLYAKLLGNKKIVVGEGFHGTGEAEAAMEIIAEQLGIPR